MVGKTVLDALAIDTPSHCLSASSLQQGGGGGGCRRGRAFGTRNIKPNPCPGCPIDDHLDWTPHSAPAAAYDNKAGFD